jgi:hypothetical protein
MSEFIAERELEFQDESDVQKVSVRLRAPQREPDGAWRCSYLIEGLPGTDDARERAAYGVDSMQAIILALVAVGNELATAPESLRRSLRYLGSDNLGFPVMSDSKPATAEIILR